MEKGCPQHVSFTWVFHTPGDQVLLSSEVLSSAWMNVSIWARGVSHHALTALTRCISSAGQILSQTWGISKDCGCRGQCLPVPVCAQQLCLPALC